MSSSTRGPDHDEAEEVLELADVLTMSATPATMPDSDGRTLALLVLVPSVAAHIGIAGAGPGDAIASALLGAGFERLARIEAPEIDSLPIQSVLSAIDAAALVQACRDDHVIAAHVPLQVIDQLSR